MSKKKFLKVTPHLPVKNLRATFDYYREQLGFSGEWTFGEKDGGISRDNLNLLFAEDKMYCSELNTSKHRLPLLWFVEGIEKIYDELRQREILIADELRIHPYDLKEFAFIDINGYYIRVAEPVKDDEKLNESSGLKE